jgi:hypothetical protein
LQRITLDEIFTHEATRIFEAMERDILGSRLMELQLQFQQEQQHIQDCESQIAQGQHGASQNDGDEDCPPCYSGDGNAPFVDEDDHLDERTPSSPRATYSEDEEEFLIGTTPTSKRGIFSDVNME